MARAWPRRKLALAAALCAACLGVLVTRVMMEGRSALARGDEAEQRGDVDETLRWWRRAARWYLPGAPHVAAAYDRLEDLAGAAEKRGESAVALAAWRAVRGSVLATRGLWTPHAERLEPANRHIAALMAAREPAEVDPGATPEQRAGWHLARLEVDTTPSVGWSVIALGGFAMWIGGAFGFALRGVSAEDVLRPRAAAVSGVAVVAGLLLWMSGLYWA